MEFWLPGAYTRERTINLKNNFLKYVFCAIVLVTLVHICGNFHAKLNMSICPIKRDKVQCSEQAIKFALN
jgi:hypothetical protein